MARDVERQRRCSADWKKRNPEKDKAATARWRKANKKRIAESWVKWRAANAKRLLEENRRWRASNPARVADLLARRRVRLTAAEVPLTVFEEAQVLAFYAIARARGVQTGVKHHVDHIIPLARGGRHHPSNLQVLTAEENVRKKDRILG